MAAKKAAKENEPVEAYIRTSITIPIAVRDRMRQSEGFNWSQIASNAFERAMDDSSDGPGFSTIEVRGRLLQTLVDSQSEEYQHGHHCGVVWARDNAKLTELQNLRQLFRTKKRNYRACVSAKGRPAHELAEYIYNGGDSVFPMEQKASATFWKKILGGDYQTAVKSRDTLIGFVQGALLVFFATDLGSETQ